MLDFVLLIIGHPHMLALWNCGMGDSSLGSYALAIIQEKEAKRKLIMSTFIDCDIAWLVFLTASQSSCWLSAFQRAFEHKQAI